MSAIAAAVEFAERAPLPDWLVRAGIAALVGRTARRLRHDAGLGDLQFARAMATKPIAVNTADANAQHYEVPEAFFARVLGPNRKYSSCLYRDAATTLAQAEQEALRETASHAGLADGQTVLELGCGWGSLTLWMAQHYRASNIVAVSNSNSQRQYIQAAAAARGLANVRVITADMNCFSPDTRFDRIVSVEMFEHMMNWHALLARMQSWLVSDGRFFMHVFTHRTGCYLFDRDDKEDWIAQHFFTGGIMPSHALIREFDDLFAVEREWRWDGSHYARTARDWLTNFDANAGEIEAILRPVYGDETALWMRRWRWFFLATEGLFGHDGGREWGVSHYLLRRA